MRGYDRVKGNMMENKQARLKLNRHNHFIRFALSVGLTLFTVLTVLIVMADIDFLRDPRALRDEHVKIALIIFVGIFAIWFSRRLMHILAYRLNRRYLAQFTQWRSMGIYQETYQRIHIQDPENKPKLKHAVLCLHSFSGSPQDFHYLEHVLESHDLCYMIPNITGFGLDSTQPLKYARWQDWVRSSIQAYDLLTTVAEKVSVVGFSMGANLALVLAQHREPHRMVLASPALFVKVDSKFSIKNIVTLPVVSTLFMWIVPYVPKMMNKDRGSLLDIMDDAVLGDIFHYLAIPMRSVKQLLLLQKHAKKNITKTRYEAMQVLYGKKDETVDMNRFLGLFASHYLDYRLTGFEKTAHSPFEDYDHDEACQLTVDFLEQEGL